MRSVNFLIFFCFYFLSLCGVLLSQDLFTFWVIIELMSLLFVLISFQESWFHCLSSLMVYFVVQSFASIGVLFFGVFCTVEFLGVVYYSVFSLFLFLKLGAFPFMGWYYHGLSALGGVSFFLALTFQKVPVIFGWFYFCWAVSGLPASAFAVFQLVGVLTLLVGCFAGVTASTLRGVLISSSIFNNGWILFSSCVDFGVFLFYIVTYSLFLGLVLVRARSPYLSVLWFSALSGFPPLPIFFLNFFIVWSLLSVVYPVTLFFLLVSSCAIMAVYIKWVFSKSTVLFSSSGVGYIFM